MRGQPPNITSHGDFTVVVFQGSISWGCRRGSGSFEGEFEASRYSQWDFMAQLVSAVRVGDALYPNYFTWLISCGCVSGGLLVVAGGMSVMVARLVV